MFALFPSPDFLFITKVVLSLLTILFAFDAIAGERERGTLQLMLSNPISRGQVLLGKFLGGYLSIAFPFLAAALIAFLLLVFSPSIALNGESWLQISFLLLVSLAYIAVFFLIGLFVSALTQRAATAALMLLEERYAVLRRKRLTLSQVLTRLSPVGAYVYAASTLNQKKDVKTPCVATAGFSLLFSIQRGD